MKEAYLKSQIKHPHAIIGSKQRSNLAFRIRDTIDVETIDQVNIHILNVSMDGRLEDHIASGLVDICPRTSFRLLRRIA